MVRDEGSNREANIRLETAGGEPAVVVTATALGTKGSERILSDVEEILETRFNVAERPNSRGPEP